MGKNTISASEEPNAKIYIHSNCKRKSDFIPFLPQNECVETFKGVLIKEMDDIKISQKSGNMTFKEMLALDGLKNAETIVIKPAENKPAENNYNEVMLELLNFIIPCINYCPLIQPIVLKNN